MGGRIRGLLGAGGMVSARFDVAAEPEKSSSGPRTPRRRGSLVVAIVALIAVLAMLTPASAVQSYVVAGPGATAVSYTPRIVPLQQGQALTFVNVDTAPHDVKSGTPASPDNLFKSAIISIGGRAPVVGVGSLARGAYAFFCTIHTNMRGTLRVI